MNDDSSSVNSQTISSEAPLPGSVAQPNKQENNDWKPIGTVVGNAGIAEFTFILERFRGTVGDVIAVPLETPSASGGRRNIIVWARITDISRFNPFFPYEAAHELANEGLDLLDTVLSNSRDQLEAHALILGCTASDDFSKLTPLNYPVQPASRVFHPPTAAIRQLLIGERANEVDLLIGSLLARPDVEVGISAKRLVSRHLAILAMTGGGKTVAARRIIRALSDVRYPMVILDPHGDYIGLWRVKHLFKGIDIKLFYPELTVTEDGEDLVFRLIEQMTQGLTEPQVDLLGQIIGKNKTVSGTSALDYCKKLKDSLVKFNVDGRKEGTKWAVVRSLNIVINRLTRMSGSNDLMRRRLSQLSFEPLPNPVSEADRIVRPGQISIIYLGGYDHITQCSIAAITLDSLFDHRASLSGVIPPFMGFIEEAHTFIPSAREGTSEAVSLPVIRRIITEGRKFGTGLVLISQRPSRVDETIISQCNSFLVLRLVNPRDQTYVQNIMENLSKSDARMLPGFGPGQGIVSGQVVRFPLPVMIKMDTELLASEIGDEDFIERVAKWKPDKDASQRQRNRERIDKIKEAAARRSSKSKS